MPAWQAAITKSLKANKALAYSRYVQLATVRPDGRPANRTVVFRCDLAFAATIYSLVHALCNSCASLADVDARLLFSAHCRLVYRYTMLSKPASCGWTFAATCPKSMDTRDGWPKVADIHDTFRVGKRSEDT